VKKLILFAFVSLCTFFFLNSCALMPHKTPPSSLIQWPADITHMEAVCEINISWNNMQYSGDMSLKLDYPEMLLMEVYGPFGNTIFSIEKDKGHFTLRAGNDEITDEKRFFDIFKMKIDDFIDDISIKGNRKQGNDGTFSIQRERYRVTYVLHDGENKMCWISPEGTMCIRFLEVNFDKGQPIGKGSDRGM
jgi:hypothetical protein